MIEPETDPEHRPRVLDVDVGRLSRGLPEAVRRANFRDADPALDRVGRASGLALAMALWTRRARHGDESEPWLVVTVGDAVRRALPTAARATVMARSPATGRLAEGQVGSDLGRRLARVTDALVLRGRAPGLTHVLHVDADGSLALFDAPELAPLGPDRIAQTLSARLGPGATLSTGRAGRAGVPFASLAAGADPPSFVGRGGLGAVFGALGLAAVHVTARPVDPEESTDDHGLARLLARSPRLRARGEGGTLELVQAFAARGDLRMRNHSAPAPLEVSDRLAREIEHAAHARKGCAGCPTPCGFVFEGQDPAGRSARGGHFSAVHALGLNLGIESLHEALELLALCDELAIDAKETGAVLALSCRATEAGRLDSGPRFGDRASLARAIEELAGGDSPARRGAAAWARELGLDAESFTALGLATRPESNLAVALGACVGARGAEPLRTFPFLLADGVGRERMEALLAPIALPRGAEDPADPAGKGRVVWWHENLVTALDALGFCAFSAAGLLADGLLDVDELARRIGTRAVREADQPGRALLALGAAVATLARAAGPPDARPTWVPALVDVPSMLGEYARLRGLDARGAPTADAWSRVGTEELLDVGLPLARDDAAPVDLVAAPRARASRRGIVEVRAFGTLARALGSGTRFEVDVPSSLADVLDEVARQRPDARPFLVDDAGRAAAYRAGTRLRYADIVLEGDRLDLVIAIGGG